jgi:magnesium-protoporphyrin O-methyltransferase
MSQADYIRRTGEIEHYFDRTALDAWKRLTGDQPVSGIRATVRKGREEMRGTLASWLPADLTGWRILDAGCGSGVLSFELIARGAEVVGIDLSAQMIAHARQRAHEIEAAHGRFKGSVTFHSGDMLDPRHGHFDAVVAMDVLIHYRPADAVRVLHTLAERTSRQMIFSLPARACCGRCWPRARFSRVVIVRRRSIRSIRRGSLLR